MAPAANVPAPGSDEWGRTNALPNMNSEPKTLTEGRAPENERGAQTRARLADRAPCVLLIYLGHAFV